jgi:hypothetical protein
MKANVFLLFLMLMAACAPAPTATLTATGVPPTATAALTPTETPEPTATREGFQTSPEGNVQVFENGKWVDIPLPDTIWGDKPEGASIVLKDNEAVLQMELNNFQTPDGSNVVDIAEYNKETKRWEVKPFSVTRSKPLEEGSDLYEKNEQFRKTPDMDARVDLFWSTPAMLGVRVTEGGNFELMIAHKHQVKIVKPDEIFISLFNFEKQGRDENLFDEDNLTSAWVIELLKRIDEHDMHHDETATPMLNYFVLQAGASEESCSTPSPNQFGEKFTDWCRSELAKGDSRKRPNKDNIDWFLQNVPESVAIDENFDLNLLSGMWDKDIRLDSIDGAYLRFYFAWR